MWIRVGVSAAFFAHQDQRASASGSFFDTRTVQKVMRIRNLSWSLIGVLLITGCQSSSGVRDQRSGNYPALQQPVFVVHQSLTVPAGKARVFLQAGGLVRSRGLGRGRYDLYQPHCALEVDVVDHDGFVVEAGTFAVTEIQRSVVSVVKREQWLASGAAWLAGHFRRNNDRFHDGYHFWLASTDQPLVRRLSCFGVYARPVDLYPPTLDEINRALGNVATLGSVEAGIKRCADGWIQEP